MEETPYRGGGVSKISGRARAGRGEGGRALGR